MSIFISIASYQDPLLSINYQKCKMHEMHLLKDLCLVYAINHHTPIDAAHRYFQRKQIIHYDHVEPQSFQKVHCWASIDCRVFIKEKIIFLQIDSHTQFEKDWDRDALINQLNSSRVIF